MRPRREARRRLRLRGPVRSLNATSCLNRPAGPNTLTALKRSTLGLDLYLWLVYRTFALRAPLRLSWRQVYRQFGAHPDNAHDKKTVQNFRIKVLRELKKIKLAWPGLNYTTAPGVLILHPSTPAIPPSSAPPRLVE